MPRAILAILLLLAACSAAPEPATTTAERVTTTIQPPTTTIPEVEVELEDCDQPPVTFSALCETFELLEAWHVDRPMDMARMAGIARDALELDFSDIPEADPPRTLFCAIPHIVFEDFCHELADLVARERLDVKALMDRVVTHTIDTSLGPFTYYLPPGEITAVRDNGVVGGVGILLDATDPVGSKCARLGPTCPLRIVFILEDNPGEAAGLQAGDVIVAVDGVPVDGQGFAAVGSQIAGDESGEVTLTIRRDGAESDVTITRAPLVVPTVSSGVPVAGVGYLRIPDFDADVPELVDEALASIEGQWSTLIVDLRDNPGGYVFAVVDVASQFISEGPLLREVEPVDGEQFVDALGPGGRATGGRLVVLVNGGTASAAEILTAALRDRRDAVVVGTPTFGKDAVQIRFDMRNGGRLDVVVAHWLSPDGESAGNGGLLPDVELELAQDMTVPEVVEAALEAAG